MTVFGPDYAAAYDAMYSGKDYSYECDQVEWALSSFGDGQGRMLLDLGCGTGRHSWEMASRGFSVVGVDQSGAMLSIAAGRGRPLPAGCTPPSFVESSIQDMRFDGLFDAALLMFAVMSYLDTNRDLEEALGAVRAALKPGGLLVADYWYGPGVLLDLPQPRTHVREMESGSVERRAEPTMVWEEDVCELTYFITSVDSEGSRSLSQERHRIRYFFGPELDLALRLSGFELLHLGRADDWAAPLNTPSWTGSLVARRVA